MGKNSTAQYFQELETEADLANRRDDEDERGMMVRAVRLGVPESYTNSIANHGQDIPKTYPEWRERILVMYEEQQKKAVFDQAMGVTRSFPKSNNTATSFPKTGGATSSSTAKPLSNAAPRDSQGRWHTIKQTTYRGAGEPMNIDVAKLMREEKCFRCQEKGHMSKDCPKKRDFRDIRSVVTAEQEQTKEKDASSAKIEEVKEMVV
ncbi:hypothetical protein ARMSODRAFT_1022533 [Armillaria solidipes]|uniref:CCHC-type domain-containing protein n=1 Tax=Armillaria solidipes TaxID=1076256 RepID=A0A2H3B8B6_9AGAR|nr:hypothetical protein ARMSODRAFT_1022533 [Armillaria solidipes]